MRWLRHFLYLVVPISTLACGAADDDATSSGQDLVGDGTEAEKGTPSAKAPIAEVTTKSSDSESGNCTAHVTTPVVSVKGDAEVTAAIAKAFEDLTGKCSDPASSDALEYTDTVEVSANELGLLSIYVKETFSSSGAAVHSYVTYNFDLSTGKLLELDDVLTTGGKATLLSACRAAAPARPETCVDALGTGAYANKPMFRATPAGLVIEVFDPSGTTPGLLEPKVAWARIADGLQPTPFGAYAKAHD
jgi:hypothetical protein